VQLQPESLRQQRLHHQPVLILGRMQRSLRLNREVIGLHPVWQPRQHCAMLLAGLPELVRELNKRRQREICMKTPVRLSKPIVSRECKARRMERSRLAQTNRRHLKRRLAACRDLPRRSAVGCLLPPRCTRAQQNHRSAVKQSLHPHRPNPHVLYSLTNPRGTCHYPSE